MRCLPPKEMWLLTWWWRVNRFETCSQEFETLNTGSWFVDNWLYVASVSHSTQVSGYCLQEVMIAFLQTISSSSLTNPLLRRKSLKHGECRNYSQDRSCCLFPGSVTTYLFLLNVISTMWKGYCCAWRNSLELKCFTQLHVTRLNPAADCYKHVIIISVRYARIYFLIPKTFRCV